jgi:hypothetical protein
MAHCLCDGRSHTTRCFGVQSAALPIDLSIVLGSGLEPTLYVIFESDLKPISKINITLCPKKPNPYQFSSQLHKIASIVIIFGTHNANIVLRKVAKLH